MSHIETFLNDPKIELVLVVVILYLISRYLGRAVVQLAQVGLQIAQTWGSDFVARVTKLEATQTEMKIDVDRIKTTQDLNYKEIRRILEEHTRTETDFQNETRSMFRDIQEGHNKLIVQVGRIVPPVDN
jgi:hypothetical protein